MRNCPTCTHNGKRVILNDYEDQDGFCLFECTACGHRYVDGLNLSQAWFDDFYTNQYRTDDQPHSDDRLASLAACVSNHLPARVLDIGGTDKELTSRLYTLGVMADASGVGDVADTNYGAVILSHTLEHIYDMPAMFARIKASLKTRGLLFIEVPVHMGYKEPKEYDYHFQHINKFRPFDLLELVGRNGFDIVVSMPLPEYREYEVWRIVGRLCNA